MSSSTSVASQLADRHATLQRRKRLRIGGGLGLVLLVGFVAWLVWFSSVLTVQSVKVEGVQRLTADQVRDAADVPTGTALARLDLDALEGNVKKLPAVSSVDVSRSWPRSVTISVRERIAVAWLTIGAQMRGVDRSGVAFRAYDRKPADLAELRVSAVGERRTKALRAAAAVADRVRRHDDGWTKQVRAVQAATRDSVTLILADGRQIVWGSEGGAQRKFEVLRSLLKLKAARYDVSAPDQPTTRG